MGPHPGRRPILALKGVVKATATSSSPPIVEKPVDGAQTAAGVVEVPQAGPAATGSVPMGAWQARKLARSQTLSWLAAAHPLAFGLDVKPLALGTGKSIWPAAKAAGIKRRAFNDALKWRTGSIAYLSALTAPGSMRFDHDGHEVEAVSDEHRELAGRRLAAAKVQTSSAASPHERGSRPPGTRVTSVQDSPNVPDG
jgi:ProQ/FINO family